MSRNVRIGALIILLIAALTALLMQFVRIPQETIVQPDYTANSGELTGTTLVGQTFVAPRDNLSGISVQFATYSDRDNTHPVELRLRMWPGEEDIRTIKVLPQEIRDNQLHTFSFESIANSGGKTFFFYLVSPQSVPGNAVTVDIHSKDPYPSGTAFIAHGAPVSLNQQATINSAGKPNVDVTFTLYHQVPIRIAFLSQAQQFVDSFSNELWIQAILMAIGFLAVILIAQQSVYTRLEAWVGKKRLVIILIAILMVVALGLRVRYAQTMPFTSDEGGYLYDARVLRTGQLAGGDGYVKSPLVIIWVMLWQLALGDTLFAGRLSSVVISVLTLLPLYWIGRGVWNERAGLVIAGAWAFVGSAIVSGIYVHTQPLALFFGVSGIALIVHALRLLSLNRSIQMMLFWGGVLLGMGVASRKSILALGLVPLLLCLVYGKTVKQKIQYLVMVGIGFVCVIAIFLTCAYLMYGSIGIQEALGFNSAEDGITANDPSQLEQVRAYSIRGMTPFFRESLPLILLTVMGLGISLERLLLLLTRRLRLHHLLSKLGWIFALLVFWWAWGFFTEYEGSAFMRFGIPWLWYAFLGVITLGIVLPRPQNQIVQLEKKEEKVVPVSMQPGFSSPLNQPIKENASLEQESLKNDVVEALLIPLWVGGLVFLYMQWIKFHANYISEFIPPLIILTGFGAYALWHRLEDVHGIVRWTARVLLGLIIVYAATVSNYITYLYEHTGQFDQRATKEAADWARTNIPFDKTLFTGAALVPYLSGHRITLDIAHPRWYAYEFTRKDPKRLNTFLPSADDMLKAFRESEWFLLDQQTGFSFLMEYSEIEKTLETNFAIQTVIDNGGNPLTFYRRIHAQ